MEETSLWDGYFNQSWQSFILTLIVKKVKRWLHHSEIQSFYEWIKKQFGPKVGFELRLGRRKKAWRKETIIPFTAKNPLLKTWLVSDNEYTHHRFVLLVATAHCAKMVNFGCNIHIYQSFGFILTKGQLFLKCLFGFFNSPKKWTKTIRLEVP